MGKWEQEKEKFMREKGMEIEEAEGKRWEEIEEEEKYRKKQNEERWRKIGEAKYNK